MKVQHLKIEGMSCGHCVMHVKKALGSLGGVQVQEVQIGEAKVVVDEARVPRDILSAAIEEAGYHLVSVE